MFEKIFNEIFGDVDFEKVFNSIHNEENEENENCSTYFHKVEDKYDNGQHVSHVEKEVKDGKVIKDINEAFKIEDKKEEKVEENELTLAEYKQKLKEANDLLLEAKETIQEQTKMIDKLKFQYDDFGEHIQFQNKKIVKLQDENKELKTKLNTITDLIKGNY